MPGWMRAIHILGCLALSIMHVCPPAHRSLEGKPLASFTGVGAFVARAFEEALSGESAWPGSNGWCINSDTTCTRESALGV
jgi:hypothetical protein